MASSNTNLILNNIAPYLAKQIGVYNSSGERVGYIPLGNLGKEFGERLYRFGFLSDVHNESDQTSDNSADFINALKYFAEKESVDFVCVSGDLTQYSYSTGNIATEMAIYQTNLNSAGIGKDVYVTTGNHDCPNSSDIDISTFFSYAGLSDIAPASGAEYSYEVTKTHTTSSGTTVTDHFLFLGMKRYEFTSNTYSTTDITWLKNKLESYKNDRCFVITHMFFPTYAGNLNDIYPSGNWLSGTMLTQVKALIDAYPHSIWFSGHSHWKWYLQKYQDRANVYPTSNAGRTTGWAVHMPSCASPIDSDGTSTRVSKPGQSEGAIIDVYEDYIDVRAIEFKGADDTDYAERYIPIGQYRLYTEPDSGTQSIYSITYNLSSSTSSSELTSITEGSSYTTDITLNSGQSLSSITVTMGGSDITSTAVSGTHISIASVTGNIVITVATTTGAFTVTYNLNNSTASNTATGVNNGEAYTTTITHSLGYRITGVTVTMGGSDITSSAVTDSVTVTDKTITISSVTGNIVITVTTEVSYNTLVVKCDAVSSGLALMVPSSDYKYLKYDDIKITLASGTDVTDTITSTSASSSNTYKVGTYNSNQKYQYVAAGEVLTAEVNTNSSSTTGYQIPIVQASSSSSCASTNIYVQLKGIEYSNNQTDWVEINNGSTLLNGSKWGKNDLSYGWFENITDDPTSLTLSTSETNTTTA
jgi:hypothetical protein